MRDGRNLRREALACKVPIVTTLAGARATVQVCSSCRGVGMGCRLCDMFSRYACLGC